MDIIADYPAYTILRKPPYAEHEGGDVIAVPFESRRHGTMYRFFKLIGAKGDPATVYAVGMPVSLTAAARPKTRHIAYTNGDILVFNGRSYNVRTKNSGEHVDLIAS